ncbi:MULTISPECIES: non-homologous end-joining DNA ligase LigD [Paraburkholderia]
MLLRVVPDEVGPRSFPETSGGKGVHVGVPLTRRQGWSKTANFEVASE